MNAFAPHAWSTLVPRAAACSCGLPIFFRNSQCLACLAPLGYDPELARILSLQADDEPGWWRSVGPHGPRRYRRCSELNGALACNWLLTEADESHRQCRCCRLNRTLPDLSFEENRLWLRRIAVAQRRLVSTLIALGLPVDSVHDDPQRGLCFDLLRQLPAGPPVITGHYNGVITLDVNEADEVQRVQQRNRLSEAYRTVLGHLRHETGHYYWQRLVDGTPWLTPFREMFGDERVDYSLALQNHYAVGPPADWDLSHVSAYASSHPWEDWAETWAHYLHAVDTLDTARGFGVDGDKVHLNYQRWSADDLQTELDPHPEAFIDLINGWMELTGVLNELSRGMGLADFYPFVLNRAALRKLHLVHCVVKSESGKQRSGSASAQAMATEVDGQQDPGRPGLGGVH